MSHKRVYIDEENIKRGGYYVFTLDDTENYSFEDDRNDEDLIHLKNKKGKIIGTFFRSGLEE